MGRIRESKKAALIASQLPSVGSFFPRERELGGKMKERLDEAIVLPKMLPFFAASVLSQSDYLPLPLMMLMNQRGVGLSLQRKILPM